MAEEESPFVLANASLKAIRYQIASLIKVLILDATHRESEPSIVGVHIGKAAGNVDVATNGGAKPTAPIVADSSGRA